MLAIHPVVQSFAILIAFYVFSLGIHRTRALHFHQKTAFNWKRHVLLGKIAFGILIAGFCSGLIMVHIHWRKAFITGLHGKIALALFPLIVFGLLSGLYMDSLKKRRKVLPIIHGINNLIVLILSVVQITTGLTVYVNFVLDR